MTLSSWTKRHWRSTMILDLYK